MQHLEGKMTTVQPKVTQLQDYKVPNYCVDAVSLHFDLYEDYAQVKSCLQVSRNTLSKHARQAMQLNGEDLILESLVLNGKVLTVDEYEIRDNKLSIFDVPDSFLLEVETKIFPQTNTELSGLYRSNNKFCTQCEAEGFRRITYFPDRPDILARYTVTIAADKKSYPYLLSNGNLIEVGDLPEGRHFARWEDPFSKPCYLFALVAGDFDVFEDQFITQSNQKVALKIYVEKGQVGMAQHAMFSLKEAMRWDEKKYGREYDLSIYMIVAISDFNMGAMENKGLNIFNSKYILANPKTASDQDYINILSIVAHEYFHNWSGNRVTCRDWFQLSLKEGLTVFRDQTFSQDLLSDGVMRIQDVSALRERQFAEDNSPMAHPVRPTSYIAIDNFYTMTVYEKGAEVIRMIQTLLGKEVFRKGMDLYFARYDGQAVTIEDFAKCMEEVSSIDLTHFKRWYSQAGTPVVTVKDHYDEKEKKYTLTLSQFTPATPGQNEKLPLYIPIQFALLDPKGNEMPLRQSVLHLTGAEQTFSFDNIAFRPVPSLLRNFSAPVKLVCDFSAADLLFLSQYDQDAFNSWEAGQRYMLHTLLQLVNMQQQGEQLKLPAELLHLFRSLLNAPITDYYLLTEKLTLPSEKYIGEQLDVIDVDAIHIAREYVLQSLAAEFESDFFELYNRCQQAVMNENFNINDISKRQLKNSCLTYLSYLPAHHELALDQFKISLGKNMTDAQSALTVLVNADSKHAGYALKTFYSAYQHDILVLDKWFTIQAAAQIPNALQQVKSLLSHSAFDIKNPNKVYSLIGAFSQRNLTTFHALDGEGYVLLKNIVQELNSYNPQVAARMVIPLTHWRRFNQARQGLMRTQLELLQKSSKLSPDLYEIVTKSLG